MQKIRRTADYEKFSTDRNFILFLQRFIYLHSFRWTTIILFKVFGDWLNYVGLRNRKNILADG